MKGQRVMVAGKEAEANATEKLLPGTDLDGRRSRESGSAVLMALLLISLLAALAMAQFAVTQTNMRSSRFFSTHSDLRQYAESGVQLAVHDLTYKLSGNGGRIGTVNWTLVSDVGGDGLSATLDEGEGDGLPTPGEPNVSPVPVGPSELGIGMVVHVEDSAFPEVKHVVATAFSGEVSATVETFARHTTAAIPRVGAIYVDPGVVLDLESSAFLVDGHDRNPDGTSGTADPLFGIATKTGSPAGSNKAALLADISPKRYKQILGSGGTPAVGETALEFREVLETFKALTTHALEPNTYSSAALGDADSGDYRVTFVNGDLHLSGDAKGSGVLIVEGSLTLTGIFSFQGLVLVAGDVRMNGSGSEAKIYGSLMVGQSLVTDVVTRTKGSGSTRVYYCSEVLSKVEGAVGQRYSIAYYSEK